MGSIAGGQTERRPGHRRNPELERLIARLSDAIAAGGDRLAARSGAPSKPLVLVVGAPRSGSTLFMQWLARSGAFAVPSNLLSRFHRAPAIGAMLERMLFDPALDFRGELALDGGTIGFDSTLGKTAGALQPNEFWYFWRRHLPLDDPEGPATIDVDALAGELAAWEAEAGRPLAMKALLLGRHLPWLARALPTAIFVDLVREPFFAMQSLLAARREHTGDERRWYSIRPPGHERHADDTPERQVAWQLRTIRDTVETGLATIPPHRQLHVDYAAFCREPGAVWRALRDRCAAAGHELPEDPPATGAFDVRDTVRVEPDREAALREAWSAVEPACV